MGYLGNGVLEIDETESLMKKHMKGVLPGKGLLDSEQHSSDCNVASVSALLNLLLILHLTLSRATEQYCAAGAILKPLCLSKLLTLSSQQHIDQLFPGYIV